jgi:hypothetical protein
VVVGEITKERMNEYEGSTEVIKKTSASLSIQNILQIIAKLYKPAPYWVLPFNIPF